jgi:hypothetical protein
MAGPPQVEVSITTTSQVMDFNNLPPLALPQITMNGNAFPPPDTSHVSQVPCGFQVVVIDSTMDMTDPASILANAAASLPQVDGSWTMTYPGLYDWLVTWVLSAGNVEEQLVFIVSFGMDANAPPTPDALEVLLDRGAGPKIQTWETTVDAGSMGGDFISQPANYILIGGSGYGYAEGFEGFDNTAGKAVTTVNATLSNPVPPGGG